MLKRIPVGHTSFSWASSQSVPVGHTKYSWGSDSKDESFLLKEQLHADQEAFKLRKKIEKGIPHKFKVKTKEMEVSFDSDENSSDSASEQELQEVNRDNASKIKIQSLGGRAG